jgi:UDP-glucose 4-epimerase
MTKIVVLGSNGFIGKHLTRTLAEDPNNNIVAFDGFKEYRQGQAEPFSDLQNVDIYLGDFLNTDDLDGALHSADYVFHLISTTTPASSDKDPLIDIDTNIKGSVELFNICLKNKVKKIIFPSSGGTVYGDSPTGFNKEDDLAIPYSPYGIGKLAIEYYLGYFKRTHGLDYIVYRLSNPYGPGQNIYGKQGVIPIFLNKILNNEELTIYGNGEMVRDYIYIDDAVNMISRTFRADTQHNTYNIGSGKGESVNQIVEILKQTTGQVINTTHVKTPLSYVEKSVLNTERFINEFGIGPETTLEAGIKETWNYIKSNYTS